VKLPDPLFWGFFVLTAVFVIAAFILVHLRGERVGAMKVPGRLGVSGRFFHPEPRKMRIRLAIAREGGGAPVVQLRIGLAMAYWMQRVDRAKALDLARCLEAASSRLRES
jgi:hypothetical protein